MLRAWRVATLSCGGLLVVTTATAGNYVYTPIAPANISNVGRGLNIHNEAVGGILRFAPHLSTFFQFEPNGSHHIFHPRAGTYVGAGIDINDNQEIVGIYSSPHNNLLPFTFNFVTKGVDRLAPRQLMFSNVAFPVAINNSGAVVGTADIPHRGNYGYLWTGNTVTIIDPPGSSFCYVRDIANDGTIVGIYNGYGGEHGFTYLNGKYTSFDVSTTSARDGLDVRSIGSGGIAGDYFDSSSNIMYGFVKSGLTVTKYLFPGTTFDSVDRALADGQVFGIYQQGGFHGFHYIGGKYYSIDIPGADNSFILGVNELGSFTGVWTDADRTQHFFEAICPAGQGPCTQ